MRRIDSEIPKYAPIIWQAEQKAPSWFKAAASIWIKTYEDFVSFCEKCDEIWAIFDDEDLAAVVYLEFHTPTFAEVHVSVVKKVSKADIVAFFILLKFQKKLDGIQLFNGWIMAKNKPMLDYGREAGFLPNGLKMKFGNINGKICEWVQVVA